MELNTTIGFATAAGTVGAAIAAAWAVVDARVSRSRDSKAKLANAVYWPLYRQTRIVRSSPWAALTSLPTELNAIREKDIDTALRADPQITLIVESIASGLRPGLMREAEAAARAIALELAMSASSTFSSSRYVQFQVMLGGAPADIISLREAWARNLSLRAIAQKVADWHGYDEFDVHILADNNVLLTGSEQVERIYKEGLARYRLSPPGNQYTAYLGVNDEKVARLEKLLERRLGLRTLVMLRAL